MRNSRLFVSFLRVMFAGVAGLGSTVAAPPAAEQVPNVSISSERMAALQAELASRATQAFLVMSDDRMVHEWYAADRGPDDKHYTASLAKAVVGGLSLAVAVDDGLISLDDKATKFVPQWKDDPLKSQILIRHLGSHTSGIQDAWVEKESEQGVDQNDFSGWEGDFWRWRTRPPGQGPDAFTIARDRAPVVFQPGSKFQYSNPGIAMLTYCVTASLRESRHKDVRSLLRDRIMRPMGVRDNEWACGYGRTVEVDGLPLVASWGGGNYTPRSLVRIGQLVLNKGRWEGKQVLSTDAIEQMTADAGFPGNCGMGWWTNRGGRYPKLPRDAVWGAGAGHQILLVIPSLRLIVVRMGNNLAGPGGRDDYDQALGRHLFNPLMEAISTSAASETKPAVDKSPGESFGAAPCPPSRVIDGLFWAPADSIVRRAKDSDNWPLTWADDDELYTTWGDGTGFIPKVERKLSCGFARISGSPHDFVGFNVRSPAEQFGSGRKGKKGWGILSVDGVLYLWFGHADNAGGGVQLAWSSDHARTWTFADWTFDEFGLMGFVNHGRDDQGASDGFVYAYSHDGPLADTPADRFVLLRAPRQRLTERAAWQFFDRANEAGEPIWTSQIARRGAVFTHGDSCLRSAMTYNSGLGRYLWWQQIPQPVGYRDRGDTRCEGGFGIYDAPHPWGPWTTAYFGSHWDVGPGEHGDFPAKWMSDDGRVVYLAFSGNDSFSVRRATISVNPKAVH